MAASSSTLASLWVDDGTGSPVKLATPHTPSKVLHGHHGGGELKDDVLQFYRGTGLEPVAKEAGVLNSNGELPISLAQSTAAYDVVHVARTTASPVRQVARQVVRQVVKTEPGGATSITPHVIRQVLPQGATVRAIKTEGGVPQIVQVRQVVAAPQQSIAPKPVQIQASPHIIHKPAQFIATPVYADTSGGTPQWHTGQKRPLEGYEMLEPGKRKKEKGGKGLRHFSMKVCEKVQRKGVTSYNEVADELVNEFADSNSMSVTDQQYDQKNIRRRVYDALNVLMAMNIISKEKKEIRWIGLPTNSAQECQNAEFEKRLRQERVRHKTQQLQELILQQIAFKKLVERNRELERRNGPPSANSAIQLPFIIVNTSKKTVIDCSISNDKYEYLFNFDNTFEIHDDIEVLKRMGMAFGLEKNQCSRHDLQRAVRMVPKALEPYVLELANVKGGSSTLGSRSLLSAGPSSSLSSAHDSLHGADPEVASATRGLMLPDSDDDSSDRSSPIDV